MKRRRKFNVLTEPFFHLLLTVMGLSLIIFLPEADSVCEDYRRIINILLDIGIGLIPTGLIGLILIFMQKNQKENEKFDQRLLLLKELDLKLRNLLNELCRLIEHEGVIERNVKRTLTQSQDKELIFTEEFRICAIQFSNEIKNFIASKTDYLLIETFDLEEMDALEILSESITELVNSLDSNSTAQIERSSKNTITSITKLLKKVPEFSLYLKMKFNGSHIS